MTDPVIAAKVPAVLDLDAGTYYWCSCGRSKNQPFCDGSHQGTDFVPMEFTLETAKKVALCTCKHAAADKKPFCDAAHRNL